MWLTKIKLAVTVVLALGVAGGGLFAYRAWGAGQESRPAEEVKEKPPRPGQDPRAAQRQEAVKALDELDALAQQMEAEWSRELTRARQEQIALDERFRRLDREHTVRQERENAERQTANRNVQEMQARRKEEAAKVARAQALAVDKRATVLESLKKALAEAEADVARAHDELKKLESHSEKQEAVRAEGLLQARKELVAADEQLRLLERRQEGRRERLRAQVRDAEDRVRQLDSGAPPARREAELERKLDLLLREVTGLRQELRRRP